MALIVNILVGLGSAIFWIIKKFFPFLIKKFGLGAVRFGIQKSISALLVLTTVAFYGAVIVFISETFKIFRDFIAILGDPSAAGFGTNEYIDCFYNLLHASGIAAGFNAAFHFGLSVFIFLFFHKLYGITQSSLKIISDEISKSLKLV